MRSEKLTFLVSNLQLPHDRHGHHGRHAHGGHVGQDRTGQDGTGRDRTGRDGSFRKSYDVLKKCLFKVSQTSFMLSFTLLKDIKTNFLCNIILSLTRVFDQSFITPQLKSETAQQKH